MKVQSIFQSILITSGLMANLLLAYKKILDNEITIGDFVVL